MKGGSKANLTRRREVQEKLRKAIVRGQFAPGTHLSDRAICELYKVSRTIVREAVRQLEAEGLVESVPNRGSFVRVLDAKEVAEIFDARAVLEAWAMRRFVRYATDAQIQEVLKELRALKTSVANREPIELADRKQKLYDLLFVAYENRYIQVMLNQTQNWSSQLRAASMSAPSYFPDTIFELDRLINAIQRRDEEGAWQASLERVMNASAAAVSVLLDREAATSSDINLRKRAKPAPSPRAIGREGAERTAGKTTKVRRVL